MTKTKTNIYLVTLGELFGGSYFSCVLGVYKNKNNCAKGICRFLEGCEGFKTWFSKLKKDLQETNDEGDDFEVKTIKDLEKLIVIDEFIGEIFYDNNVPFDIFQIKDGDEFDWEGIRPLKCDPDLLLDLVYAERALNLKEEYETDFYEVRHRMGFERLIIFLLNFFLIFIRK